MTSALRLLDHEGLDALSMRRIAEGLGTGAASLYWHVGSKDGLLDLLLDHVIGEQQVPDPQPERWQEQIKEVAREMRRAVLRHRDIVRVSVGRIPVGPNALRYSERVLAILRAGGVPDQLALSGHHLLIATVNGFTLDETVDPRRPGTAEPAPESPAMVRDYLASLPRTQFPNLVEVMSQSVIGGDDERFELLIDIFVEGLARRAGATATAPPPSP